MALDKLRYYLTEHTEKFFFTYENLRLLIHPSVTSHWDLLNKLEDDIELMPKIKKTQDDTDIEFYRFDYSKKVYPKSELPLIMIGILLRVLTQQNLNITFG